MASLAAILIVVGFRLANPKQLGHVWEIGWDQFLIFSTTLMVTLIEDLLIGVLAGLLLKFVLHLIRFRRPITFFKIQMSRRERQGATVLSVSGPVVFSNFLWLRRELEALPADHPVVLDLEKSPLIDHTMMEHLERFQEDFVAQGKSFKILWSDQHQRVSKHPLSSRRLKGGRKAAASS
jgi:MFS superfamily sulfate permease-like transporter